jgi:hypothetical protein
LNNNNFVREYLAITWFPNHNVTIIAALAGLAAIAVKLMIAYTKPSRGLYSGGSISDDETVGLHKFES